MRRIELVPLLLLCLAASAAAEGGADGREPVFAALSSETAAVREDAQRRLERAADLGEDELRAAIAATSSTRVRPYLFRIAAARGMKGLAGEIASSLAFPDPVVSDAAARALVSLGEEAVGAGRTALQAASGADPAVRIHLDALAAQRAVERELLARWRRKGGSYEGRYKDLAKLGWPVQPVLLAMLLDIPLRDRWVVLPDVRDPAALEEARTAALRDISESNRRGYRTFAPLPVHVETEHLFELAAQALKDVADLDLMGDILEEVAGDLESAHKLARHFRLRPFEEHYYQELDVILFARGRPERLERLGEEMREKMEGESRWLNRDARSGADALNFLSRSISEYAAVLHQLRRYDEAAERYAEVLKIGRKLGGKEPAIASYNRACALAQGGRKDEALAQLARSLDRNISAGSEDLTREWVTEDGDLATLRDDPRYDALIRSRYGESEVRRGDGESPDDGPSRPPGPLRPDPPK